MTDAEELVRLRLELATLRQAIDAHAMTISFDAQANVNGVNDAFCRLANCRREDLLGRPFRLLETDNQPHEVMLAIQRSVVEGQVWQGQIEGASRDGRPFWLEVTVVPFRSEGQRMADTIALCTDITASRRLAERFEHSEAQYRTLVNSLSEVVLRTDDLGMITFVNAAWEALSGVGAEQVRGRSLLEFVHPDDHEGCVQDFDALLHHGQAACVRELRLITPDGHERWMEAHLQGLAPSGDVAAGVVGTLTDITERHQASAALLQAKETAEAASRLKSAFLANMSHEVRTPLNGMIGLTDVVLATALDDAQRQYLQAAKASAESLMALFDNILHYADLEAGRVALAQVPFELQPLLAQSLHGIASGARAQGLDLSLELDPALPELALGDPARLRLVLARLLDNALKFTAAGQVALRAGPNPLQPGELLITVADSGIGIPLEVQPHIFEPFVQEDGSATRRFGGTGLGLSIVHRLVQMMGGRISLHSRPGQGSEFALSLPLAPAPQGRAPAQATPVPAASARDARRATYAQGLKRADAETVGLIAGPFADQAPLDMAAMRQALQDGDAAALLRQAHAMKGLLLSFEAHGASELASLLQAQGERQPLNVAAAGQALDALDDELAQLLPLLREVAQAGLASLS
ncbi:PAS domain S-box [Burkholderiales bacterium JOSHI_001]|nr:PAS domain S-box [Burkholderiales bacterium JOSHI_001]